MNFSPIASLPALAADGNERLNDALRRSVHDMCSPLQTMMASAETLDAAQFDPAAAPALARIRRSMQALESQLNDLTTLVRIQKGALTPAPISFELGALLEELEELALPLAADKGLVLNVKRLCAPVFVFADASLIYQALARTVRVLIQVAPHGEIRLCTDEKDVRAHLRTFHVRCSIRPRHRLELEERLLFAQMITTGLGGDFQWIEESDGSHSVSLTLPVQHEDPDDSHFV